MEYKVILWAGLKKHKGSLAGIFILMTTAFAVLGAVLSVLVNSRNYIDSEMERIGYGDITAWISGISADDMAKDISSIPEVDKAEIQPVIITEYKFGETESDSEGQLILYQPEKYSYRIFTEDMRSYGTAEIKKGSVLISPSLCTSMGVSFGDEIVFPIARNGGDVTLTVSGFYEDPFMGSSMIGMKGFLICDEDFNEITDIIADSGINSLARSGAMLHIFGNEDTELSRLNEVINSNTRLSGYCEFAHSKTAISGFMLILQNAFCGLAAAFAVVLILVTAAVLAHNISGGIAEDKTNIGILRAIGFTSRKLRRIQLLQYTLPVISGMAVGLAISVPAAMVIGNGMVTVTGFLTPRAVPLGLFLYAFLSFSEHLFCLYRLKRER